MASLMKRVGSWASTVAAAASSPSDPFVGRSLAIDEEVKVFVEAALAEGERGGKTS